MNEDQTLQLISAIGCLVLVASALIARRLPIALTLRMIFIWVAIFTGIFVLFALRSDFGAIWQKVKLAAFGQSASAIGQPVMVAMNDDGHFWVNATVKGQSMRFLVDSGATTTAFSRKAAEAVGLDVDSTGFPVLISTANGMIEARRARVALIDIEGIVREDLAVTVSDELGDSNLLGMNFLSTLSSWRVEGRTLILVP